MTGEIFLVGVGLVEEKFCLVVLESKKQLFSAVLHLKRTKKVAFG